MERTTSLLERLEDAATGSLRVLEELRDDPGTPAMVRAKCSAAILSELRLRREPGQVRDPFRYVPGRVVKVQDDGTETVDQARLVAALPALLDELRMADPAAWEKVEQEAERRWERLVEDRVAAREWQEKKAAERRSEPVDPPDNRSPQAPTDDTGAGELAAAGADSGEYDENGVGEYDPPGVVLPMPVKVWSPDPALTQRHTPWRKPDPRSEPLV